LHSPLLQYSISVSAPVRLATSRLGLLYSAMTEEWIIRVDGKEYGPADLTTLREWKAEGRVLAVNEARRADATDWNKAAQIPGLFEEARPPVQTAHRQVATSKPGSPFPIPVSTRAIIPETFRIYVRGFFP